MHAMWSNLYEKKTSCRIFGIYKCTYTNVYTCVHIHVHIKLKEFKDI